MFSTEFVGVLYFSLGRAEERLQKLEAAAAAYGRALGLLAGARQAAKQPRPPSPGTSEIERDLLHGHAKTLTLSGRREEALIPFIGLLRFFTGRPREPAAEEPTAERPAILPEHEEDYWATLVRLRFVCLGSRGPDLGPSKSGSRPRFRTGLNPT